MEGYDTLLLGQFYANQAFAQRFGFFDTVSQKYQIPSQWQVGLGVSVQIGQILGLQITGWASERFGYRPTMMTALVALTGFLFIQFFAVNLPMLLVGYILLGFPWGTFQTMTVSYAAEVMPVQIRPFLTTYVNLCWVSRTPSLPFRTEVPTTDSPRLSAKSSALVSTALSSTTVPSGRTRSPLPSNGSGPFPSSLVSFTLPNPLGGSPVVAASRMPNAPSSSSPTVPPLNSPRSKSP
jgi:hypothetical protein